MKKRCKLHNNMKLTLHDINTQSPSIKPKTTPSEKPQTGCNWLGAKRIKNRVKSNWTKFKERTGKKLYPKLSKQKNQFGFCGAVLQVVFLACDVWLVLNIRIIEVYFPIPTWLFCLVVRTG